MRRVHADEQPPGLTYRPAGPQVLCQSLSHLAWQRQRLQPISLAMHGHYSFVPIEVIQRKRDHFAGAQPEPRQQQQDGVVPLPRSRAAVATVEQRLDLLGCERLRQSRQTPVRDRGDRAGEVDGDVAALVQVTQEAAEHRDDQLGAGTAEAPSLAQDELIGVPDPERPERDFPGPEVLGEKGTNNGQVVRDRRRTDAALVDEKPLVDSFDPIDRRVAARAGNGGRDDAAAAQVAQQLPAGYCLATPPAARPPGEQESPDPLLVEILDAKLFAFEPTAECLDEPKLLPG